jgi:hypothetical protein
MILPLLNEDALRLPTLSNVFFRLLLNISEAAPTVFLMLENALTEQLLKCLCWAVGGASGMEPTRLAMETITIICRTLGMSTDTEESQFTYALFNLLGAVSFLLGVVISFSFRSYSKWQFIQALSWTWSCTCLRFERFILLFVSIRYCIY